MERKNKIKYTCLLPRHNRRPNTSAGCTVLLPGRFAGNPFDLRYDDSLRVPAGNTGRHRRHTSSYDTTALVPYLYRMAVRFIRRSCSDGIFGGIRTHEFGGYTPTSVLTSGSFPPACVITAYLNYPPVPFDILKGLPTDKRSGRHRFRCNNGVKTCSPPSEIQVILEKITNVFVFENFVKRKLLLRSFSLSGVNLPRARFDRLDAGRTTRTIVDFWSRS